jgi:hypothetical protein
MSASNSIQENNINEIENNYNSEIEAIKSRGNIIVRQELKSLTPRCDALFAIVLNLILIFIFLIFGIPIIIYSSNKIEYRKLYSNSEWY